MTDLVPQIYHEKQDPGSMLCAQHALNNLLQSSLFTPQDLADIARRLDQLEQEQLDIDDGGGESHNYDDSGFFSIMVMEEALKVLGLRLVRWKSKEMVDFHDKPESMEGFVLNHQLHWYTIRRFGTETRWYNLDSCIPAATWISPMYLGLTLREAELQGYSILAVLPTDDALITGLPACPATTLALTLPAPSSTTSSYSRSSGASTNPFQGKGNTLGSSSTSSSSKPSTSTSSSSSSSTLPKPLRTTSKRRQDSPSPTRSGSASASGSGSSVEEESEKRRRRPRLDVDEDMDGSAGGGEEMSEEDQMALAIAESMKASSLEDLGDGGLDGKEKEKGKKEEGKREGRSRAERDEDDELEAALKASLDESSGGGREKEKEKAKAQEVEVEEGEDDSPSVEELRRRRLARFG